MSEYLKTVVIAVVAVSVISVLFSKDSFGKYADLLAGIVVMTVVVAPIFNIGKEMETNFDSIDIKQIEPIATSYLMDEFEKELATKVRGEIKRRTNTEVLVTVYARQTEDTVEINQVEISPYSGEYVQIICEFLGIEEEKVTKK
ncbi:MAG: hypothetical protein J6R66_05510 [Clostridia bacterium]|nr:hypothetical protein [Clostridia bacterium]